MTRAFTLIELLIVVAIIAILAAIAVPNFLEAQTRSKISRIKADMRIQTTALESYAVENNAYPNCHETGAPFRATPGDPAILERLSTPIAYIGNSFVRDPFAILFRLSANNALAMKTATATSVSPATDKPAEFNSYLYQSWNDLQRYTLPPDAPFSDGSLATKSSGWLFQSCGPDGTYYDVRDVLANDGPDDMQHTLDMIYDPSNGTVSRGSIWRAGGQTGAAGTYKAGGGLSAAIRTQR